MATKKAKKATKKVAKKAKPKKAAPKKVVKKAAPKKKRQPNPAFMRPLTPSGDLAAVIGNKPVPRTEAVKKMWEYIRKNNLQDAKNRRMINADGNCRFGRSGKRNASRTADNLDHR